MINPKVWESFKRERIADLEDRATKLETPKRKASKSKARK